MIYADGESTASSAAPLKKNLIIFMVDTTINSMHHDRVFKFLQPEFVGWNVAAETSQAFIELTRNSAGMWNVLLTDVPTALAHSGLIDQFIAENPQVVVGVEYATALSSQEHASDQLSIARATIFPRPSDIDEWLLLMHQLLG